MKEMKRQIIITCLIVSIIGTIISGSYNVIALQKNFFTAGSFVEGLVVALVYLIYLWIKLKQREKIFYIIFIIFIFLLLIFLFFERDVVKEVITFNWKETAMVVLYSNSFTIAKKQVELSQE